MEVSVIKIGNSKGIRLSKTLLHKYNIKDTVVIAPMRTSSKKYPTRIEIKHENKIGWIILDQIRTIYKQRIIRDLGRLTKSEISELNSVLKETYVN